VTRLDDRTRSILYQEIRYLKIGFVFCPICGEETPEPTADEQADFARSIEPGRGLTPLDAMFMWPDPDPEHGGWIPKGWHEDVVDDERVLICPECHDAKLATQRAQRARRKEKKR